MIVTGQKLGTELCVALGLDPTKVQYLSIQCSLSQPALVDVTYRVDSEQIEPLTQVFKTYKLHEAE